MHSKNIAGRGARIVDVDGNEFLDFTTGIAVNSTGHCHPEVVQAILLAHYDFAAQVETNQMKDCLAKIDANRV